MNTKLDYGVSSPSPSKKTQVEVFETPDYREILINGIPIEELDISDISEISYKLYEKLDIDQQVKFIGKFAKRCDDSASDKREVGSDIYRVTTLEL